MERRDLLDGLAVGLPQDAISFVVATGDSAAPIVGVHTRVTNDPTPALSGTIDDPAATIQVAVNGRRYVAINLGSTWSLADNTVAALAEGVYDVTVDATDSAGNIGTDGTVAELRIDCTPPKVTVNVLATPDTTPQLSGQVNDTTASVRVTVQGTLYAATNNRNGTWTVADNTIAPLASGTYSVTATACDLAGNVGAETTANELTIVTASNSPPIGAADAYCGNEDTTLVVPVASGVLANDSDTDRDPLTAVLLASPGHGTLSLFSNGSFLYTPSLHWHGTDSFQYRAYDAKDYSAPITVTLAVAHVNHLPVIVDHSYVMAQGETFAVAAPGLLSGASDIDLDPLGMCCVASPAHGTLTLCLDGSFVYTPAADWYGRDSFACKAYDGTGYSNLATVVLTVNRAQRPTPVVVDSVEINGGAAQRSRVTAMKVTFSAATTFSDLPHAFEMIKREGGTAVAVAATTSVVGGKTVATLAFGGAGTQYGSLADGSYLLTVRGDKVDNFDGDNSGEAGGDYRFGAAKADQCYRWFGDSDADWDADGIDYSVFCGTYGRSSGDSKYQVSMDFNADGKVDATDLAQFIARNGKKLTAPAGGVVDVGLQPPVNILLNPHAIPENAAGAVVGTVTAIDPDSGDTHAFAVSDGRFEVAGTQLQLKAGQSLDCETEPSVTLVITAVDRSGGSCSRPFRITVLDVDEIPPAAPTSLAIDPDTGISDADGITNIGTVTLHGTLAEPGLQVYVANLTADADLGPATVTGTAFAKALELVDGFHRLRVRAVDAAGNVSADSFFDVLVDRTAPEVSIDPQTTNDSTPQLSGTVFDNAVAENERTAPSPFPSVQAGTMSDAASAVRVLLNGQQYEALPCGTIWTLADNTITCGLADGVYDVVASAWDNAGNQATAVAELHIDLTAPVATVDPLTTTDTTPPLSGRVDDSAAAVRVTVNGTDYLATNRQDGTWGLADNTLSPPLAAGNYSISVTAIDPVGNAGTGNANALTIIAPNGAPVAAADVYDAAEDTALIVPIASGVLANDSDAEHDPLTAVWLSGPGHGTLSLSSTGSFLYTPALHWHGTDSFQYRACDAEGCSTAVTVTLRVAHLNHLPVVVDRSYVMRQGDVLSVATPGLLDGVTDIDGEMLAVSAVAGPSHGVLAVNADGSFQYTPSSNWYGADSFTYRAHDGTGYSNVATVAITVNRADLPTPVVVESVAVNDGSAQRSMVSSVTVTFSSTITIADGALSVVRRGGGAQLVVTVATFVAEGKTVATLSFSGAGTQYGSLADGSYLLTIFADKIQNFDGDRNGVAGGDYQFGAQKADRFYRWFGDSDGDWDTDGVDYAVFTTTYQKSAGDRYFQACMDFNGDGKVNQTDLAQFVTRNGRRLVY